MNISESRKAVAQALTGLVAWATAVTLSEESSITSSEWVILLGVAVGAFLVWWVPNVPATVNIRERLGERGAGQLVTILVVIALVLVILWLLGFQVRIG